MSDVKRPEDMSPRLAAAFNAADHNAMAALYEPRAILVDDTGARHQGTDAIRAVLTAMLEAGGVMASTPRFAVVAGDVALCGADWRLDATAAGGGVALAEGRSLEVLRRQADGTWRYLIDCPSGAIEGQGT